ncbi:G patch domain-containing protein [Candidatus Bathyarchaeota archaeon]|nr:G patch domain-containing protein [Candidatus Bathyarchaeota archaeon]
MAHRESSSRPGLGLETESRDPDDYENDDDIPLEHKKPFGAGLKRKRSVAFVRASDPELHTTTFATPQAQTPSTNSVADFYLNLVMKGSKDKVPEPAPPEPAEAQIPLAQQAVMSQYICSVCNTPLDASDIRKHEASIPHQVALTHSHPPSAIDRSRMGLSYLSSFGWDPDARRGLGPDGQGIRDPIRVRPKDDTLGLGVVIPQEYIDKAREPKPKKMSIKDLRAREAEERAKGERLREMFYRSDDVLRHLGHEM